MVCTVRMVCRKGVWSCATQVAGLPWMCPRTAVVPTVVAAVLPAQLALALLALRGRGLAQRRRGVHAERHGQPVRHAVASDGPGDHHVQHGEPTVVHGHLAAQVATQVDRSRRTCALCAGRPVRARRRLRRLRQRALGRGDCGAAGAQRTETTLATPGQRPSLEITRASARFDTSSGCCARDGCAEAVVVARQP